jgi:hypothetical protein
MEKQNVKNAKNIEYMKSILIESINLTPLNLKKLNIFFDKLLIELNNNKIVTTFDPENLLLPGNLIVQSTNKKIKSQSQAIGSPSRSSRIQPIETRIPGKRPTNKKIKSQSQTIETSETSTQSPGKRPTIQIARSQSQPNGSPSRSSETSTQSPGKRSTNKKIKSPSRSSETSMQSTQSPGKRPPNKKIKSQSQTIEPSMPEKRSRKSKKQKDSQPDTQSNIPLQKKTDNIYNFRDILKCISSSL